MEDTHIEKQEEGTRNTYIELWRFRVYPCAGKLIAEGVYFGNPELGLRERELQLEVAQDERSVPEVLEARPSFRGVVLVREGREWRIRQWQGGAPTEEFENVMYKEFARHKAMHLEMVQLNKERNKVSPALPA